MGVSHSHVRFFPSHAFLGIEEVFVYLFIVKSEKESTEEHVVYWSCLVLEFEHIFQGAE
jgi:hypothetical protein